MKYERKKKQEFNKWKAASFVIERNDFDVFVMKKYLKLQDRYYIVPTNPDVMGYNVNKLVRNMTKKAQKYNEIRVKNEKV